MTGYEDSPVTGYEDWSRSGWRTHLPGVADVPDSVARLGDETIPALAAAAASRVPDRVAVTVDGEPVTHAELDDAASRVAAWLASRVHPGDRVLLAAGASVGFVRCYLGALRAGAVVVLANPGYTAAELGHLAADSGAVLAFADPEPMRLLAALRPRGPGKPAAPGSALLVTADVRALPERRWPPAGRDPAARYGAARVHLRHDRQAQRGAADPPPAGGLDPGGDGRLAVAFRRRAGPCAAAGWGVRGVRRGRGDRGKKERGIGGREGGGRRGGERGGGEMGGGREGRGMRTRSCWPGGQRVFRVAKLPRNQLGKIVRSALSELR